MRGRVAAGVDDDDEGPPFPSTRKTVATNTAATITAATVGTRTMSRRRSSPVGTLVFRYRTVIVPVTSVGWESSRKL